MEHQAFDDLSRTFAMTRSRRGVLGVLGGLLGLGVLGEEEAAGKDQHKKRRRKQRRRKKQERRNQRQARENYCDDLLKRAGCTFSRVGLADAWQCPKGAELKGQLGIYGCNLAGAQLKGVIISGGVTKTVLNNADLSEAMISGYFAATSMVQTKFVRATMVGIIFKDVGDTRGADFSHADLRNAAFQNSNLAGAIFEQADLQPVSWCAGITCPDGVSTWQTTGCCSHLNGATAKRCISSRDPRCS